jgi:hypothetical protein
VRLEISFGVPIFRSQLKTRFRFMGSITFAKQVRSSWESTGEIVDSREL